MIDFEAPSSLVAVEALRDGRTRELLFKFAERLTHDAAAAQDLVSEALLLVCDPVDGRPWDAAGGSFLTHMRIVVRDVARAGRRSARSRHEVPDTAATDRAPSPFPRPDDAVSDALDLERLRRVGARVRDRLAHNARTLAVFDSLCESDDRAHEIAARLGCAVAEVYDSNEQIAYHAGRALAEERAAEAKKVNERRRRATREGSS